MSLEKSFQQSKLAYQAFGQDRILSVQRTTFLALPSKDMLKSKGLSSALYPTAKARGLYGTFCKG